MSHRQTKQRLKTVANKSLHSEYSHFQLSSPQPSRKKTQSQYSNLAKDSLQIFQQELNSVIRSTKKKREPRSAKAYTDYFRPSSESQNLKKEISSLKTQLQSQKQLKSVQSKLDNLIISLEQQKFRQIEKISATTSTPTYIKQPSPQSMIIPYPQFYPQPMYPPYFYPPYDSMHQPRRKGYTESDQEEGYRSKKSRLFRTKRKISRLRVIFYVVFYSILVKKQAKKLANARKSDLRNFWMNKQQSQMNNLKNWLLETQKFSLSIILQKKNLNLSYIDEKSQRVKKQKQKFILQVVGIGINKMLQDCTSQKLSLFTDLLLNTCKRGSFAVNRLWTAFQLEQVCVSEYFGFFRIDSSLQKYLIGVLVFIKVFIYNMLLQPNKFDVQNFPKKEQPLNNNMKIIASIYYHLIKQIINQYKNELRNSGIFKTGNWLNVPKQHIVQCSEPLVYGSKHVDDDEHISGLVDEFEVSSLRNFQSWSICSKKLKLVVEKLHTETVSKARMAKKNFMYKLNH